MLSHIYGFLGGLTAVEAVLSGKKEIIRIELAWFGKKDEAELITLLAATREAWVLRCLLRPS